MFSFVVVVLETDSRDLLEVEVKLASYLPLTLARVYS